MKVYIAGKVTGNIAYRQQFAAAEARLAEMGHSVMNPAWLCSYPEFEYKDYIAVSRAMLERCEGILLLPFWRQSAGARAELEWAREHGLAVFDASDDDTGCNGGWAELIAIGMRQGLCGVDPKDVEEDVAAAVKELEAKKKRGKARKGGKNEL